MTTRKFWLDTLLKIATPVLSAMAEGKLKEKMPVETKTGVDRFDVTHLEALGRTLVGLSPWLEAPAADPTEEATRVHMAELARRAIANAVDPNSPDFCRITDNQHLVDMAFLGQSILRAPVELFEKLDKTTQSNLIVAFKNTRALQAYRCNWLLFMAMVETTLYFMTGDCDKMRIDYALCMHEEWYKGDGTYGDGSHFCWDYYNGYVIQPMLVDIVTAAAPIIVGENYAERMESFVMKNAVRYATVQERLISPEGAFPAVGRSITYRAGAFHPLAQMAWLGRLPEDVSAAQVRCALTAVIKRCFSAEGTFDENGWLTIGFCGHQPSLGEDYISTGSLYLCTAVFLPLGLSEDHPFWSDPDALYTAQKIWSGVDMPADRAIHK